MKIGILTWSKAVNHGAILQTYALQKTLESRKCKVIELDYNFFEEKRIINNKAYFKKLIKKININGISSKIKLSSWTKDKAFKFEQFAKNEMHIGLMYNVDQHLDKVVIGSDMVFDFYEGYNPYMYGKDVKCNYIFSYAACFGYTTPKIFETFEMKDKIISYLKKMKGISYRDYNTGEILKINCKIGNCVKTIDPVLLYGFSKERKEWNNYGWSKKNYILIYSYTYNMDTFLEIKTIKKFAQAKNLEIISVGYYHKWCDKSVNADPKEFVELFENAKYVITDTFHGTVFSITFNKMFMTIIRNNSFKILDLLKDLDLNNRVCIDIEKDIKKLPNQIKYDLVNEKIDKLRKESFNYLMYHIGK